MTPYPFLFSIQWMSNDMPLHTSITLACFADIMKMCEVSIFFLLFHQALESSSSFTKLSKGLFKVLRATHLLFHFFYQNQFFWEWVRRFQTKIFGAIKMVWKNLITKYLVFFTVWNFETKLEWFWCTSFVVTSTYFIFEIPEKESKSSEKQGNQ